MRALLAAIAVAALATTAATAAAAGPSGVDETIDAYFALLSGPSGDRDWTAFRALFLPAARVDAMGVDEEGDPGFYPTDLEGYVGHLSDFLATRGFYQRDACRRSFVHGRTATVVATFESRLRPDGDVIDRGVISFHLVFVEEAWRIAGVLWNSATRDDPAPGESLGCSARARPPASVPAR